MKVFRGFINYLNTMINDNIYNQIMMVHKQKCFINTAYTFHGKINKTQLSSTVEFEFITANN